MCWAHLARTVEGLVTRGGDGTHIGVWARSLYRSLFADRSAFVEDRTSLRTYQRRTRQMQSGFGELLTGLAPIHRTVMGLEADGADGWEASKATGLR